MKCGYTEDTEEKGKVPLTRILQREEFSKTLSQAMYELKEEIWGLKRERHVDPSGGFLHQERPNTSYYMYEHSTTQPDL